MLFKERKVNYFILIILLIGTVWIWSAVLKQAPDNILEVHFFDIGQGDSIFIETPQGKQVLIDGGPDKTVLEKLGKTMPFYDRTIDLVILTHPDADHITGLVEVLKYYQVEYILFSGLEKDTAVYQKWEDIIKEKNISLTIAQTGQKVILEKGIIMNILWPEQSLAESFTKKANNSSVVGQLIYEQIEFLLTGDIEKEIEQRLVNQNLESDILKVPHHGSKTSTSYNFFKAVNPQIAVISVGLDNYYKHPHEDILERLKNVLVYRTDKNGDIEILTDGNLLQIKTEK
ncbi:MAG: MBL fold metallo-hydrolase [Parcubacteria group bacterium]|nr:MBL fold metallo-hydrolase [Parcubacteria group bacterium]